MRFPRRGATLVLAVLVGLLGAALPVAPRVAAAQPASWKVVRIGGDDRYATAANLAKHTFRRRTPQVLVASGEQFADALAATPAAARLGAPLLLTRKNQVPTSTYEQLKRLRPSVILLAGGTGTVSFAVEQRLATIARVLRVAGADRFETAAKLSAIAFGTGVPVVFLAQGRSFPDALAAGAAAGRLQGPVLLVERSSVPKVVAKELARLRPARIVLVGGEGAVGKGVAAAVQHGDVDRVGGANRYATASAIAALVPGRATVALVASGTTFPDALAAGPSASALGGTFALTTKSCLPTEAAQGLADDGVSEVLIIGGENAVPDVGSDPCQPVTANPTPPATTPPPVEAPPADGTEPVLQPFSSLAQDVADPTVLKVGTRWYAYSTQVYLTQIPVRSSTDLRTWTKATEAMPSLAAWAEFGAHWAPTVVAAGGRYVMWYSARHQASGRQCISRAVADRPEGPFHDELRAAPICQTTLGGSIDPHVFTDTDGSRWLSWKSDENAVGRPSRLWVAPLSADGRSLTGQPSALLTQGAPWETFTIEQPAIVRQGALYYLFYSGGFWESSGYAIGYATATSPRGPFTKRTTAGPWVGTAPRAAGPGALDVFVGPDGRLWATYHAWADTVGYANFGMRSLRIARLGL